MSDELRRAYALARAGEKAEARKIIARALQANPDNGQAWAVMSEIVDTPDQAADCLRRVLKLSQDPAVLKWAQDRLIKLTGQSGPLPPPPPPPPAMPPAQRIPIIEPVIDVSSADYRPSWLQEGDEDELEMEAGQPFEDPLADLNRMFDDPVTPASKPTEPTRPPAGAGSRPAAGQPDEPDDPDQTSDEWFTWDAPTVVAPRASAEELLASSTSQALPGAPQARGDLPLRDRVGIEQVGNIFDDEPDTPAGELLPELTRGNLDLDINLDEDEEELPKKETKKKRGGCGRLIFFLLVALLVLLLAAAAAIYFLGLQVPGPLNAVIPQVNPQAAPVAEDDQPQVTATPAQTPTPEPTPTETPIPTPTPLPTESITGLPLLTVEAQPFATISAAETPIDAFVLSPVAGRIVVRSGDRLLLLAEGELVELGEATGPLAFSPVEDSLLAVASDETVRLIDLGVQETIAEIDGFSDAVSFVAFGPDGSQLLTGTADGQASFWDVRDPEDPDLLDEVDTGAGLQGLAWMPDASGFAAALATGEDRTTIAVYDVTAGEYTRLTEVSGPVTALDVSPVRGSGIQVAFAGADGRVTLLNAATGSVRTLLDVSAPAPEQEETEGTPTPAAEEAAPEAAITGLGFSPTGLLGVLYADGALALWAGETFEPVGASGVGAGPAAGPFWARDGSILYWASTDTIFLVPLTGLRLPLPGEAGGPGAGQLAASLLHEIERGGLSLDLFIGEDLDSLETGRTDNRIERLDISPGAEEPGEITLATQGPEASNLEALAFSPDGSLAAAGLPDGTVLVWNIVSGETLFSLIGLVDGITALRFSPDAALVAGAEASGTVLVWDISDVNTAEVERQTDLTLAAHSEAVNSLAWSPDGAALASASADETVILWDAQNGDQLETLRGLNGGASAVAFSPDGTLIATAAAQSGQILLWDAQTAQVEARLPGDGFDPLLLAFNPAGTALMSATNNGSVRLWSLDGVEYVEALPPNGVAAAAAAFAADGSVLAAADAEGTIRVWQLGR